MIMIFEGQQKCECMEDLQPVGNVIVHWKSLCVVI